MGSCSPGLYCLVLHILLWVFRTSASSRAFIWGFQGERSEVDWCVGWWLLWILLLGHPGAWWVGAQMQPGLLFHLILLRHQEKLLIKKSRHLVTLNCQMTEWMQLETSLLPAAEPQVLEQPTLATVFGNGFVEHTNAIWSLLELIRRSSEWHTQKENYSLLCVMILDKL